MAGLTCHLRGTLLNCAIRACHPNKLNFHSPIDEILEHEVKDLGGR